MSLFLEELKIMNQNTVTLMIEEQQRLLDEKGRQLEKYKRYFEKMGGKGLEDM